MESDSRDNANPMPEPPVLHGTGPEKQAAENAVRGSSTQDLDPATAGDVTGTGQEDDDEATLPEAVDEGAEVVAEGPLAIGRAAIEHAVRHAPTSPGVYRMLNAANDVLYVGKA